jgi:hypothetical protein
MRKATYGRDRGERTHGGGGGGGGRAECEANAALSSSSLEDVEERRRHAKRNCAK